MTLTPKKDFQIIIPLTGNGSRFKDAGYSRLKPFIKVQGKPMIEWIVSMFPGDADKIIFVCREEHILELDYVEKELNRIAPKAKIFNVKKWIKKGPVSDVLLAADLIDDKKPALVSYCDYYMHWDYENFKQSTLENKCSGSIPCYSGFHPNLVPLKNLYASCKVDNKDNLIEIKEKFTWTKDKEQSRHSPGIYHFANGRILKDFFAETLKSDSQINGEFYVSLVYNFMVKKGLKVWCPINIQHFCQWGTPFDLEEFNYWINSIKTQGVE